MAAWFAAATDALEAAVCRSTAFRAWLRGRRWCGEAVGLRAELTIRDEAVLEETSTEFLLFLLVLAREDAGSVLIHLPLSVATSRFAADAFELAVGPDRVYVLEAERRDTYARVILEGLRSGRKVPLRAGDALRFQGERLAAFRALESPAASDSSNLLLHITTTEGGLVVKSYKMLDPHNREPSILERLHRRRFAHALHLVGQISLGHGEERLVVGTATERVAAVDLFTWLVDGWRDALRREPPGAEPFEDATRTLASKLGDATAALHAALADRKPGPFQAEAFTVDDAQAAYRQATRYLTDSLRLLKNVPPAIAAPRSERVSEARALLLDHRREIEDALAYLHAGVGTVKCVTHGDLHLGQVLFSERDAALTFIDFEGEPDRPPALRSLKLPPLRDVATMARSFAYVRHVAERDQMAFTGPGDGPRSQEGSPVPDVHGFVSQLRSWEASTVRAYRDAYMARTDLYPDLDPELAERLIRGWAMEKALYELRYELMHRPANVPIPLEGILAMAEGRA